MITILNLAFDPIVCAIYASIFLTIGLAFLWNRFIVHTYPYMITSSTEMKVNHKIKQQTCFEQWQHPVLNWIVKCVRKKESNEGPSCLFRSHV